ncbi:MAG TPA: hypothetical protein VF221_08490 [Chloroflexota bacterium]
MKRLSRILPLVVVTALFSLHPGAAHAMTPTVETVQVNTSDLIPAGSLCNFDLTFTGTGTVTMTTYYDNRGTPTRQSIHGALLHTLSGPAGSLSTNGPAPVHIDLITGTSTDTGNEYHFNLAGHGVVLAGTGRLVVDSGGNVILQTGYTVSPYRIPALCAVLGP